MGCFLPRALPNSEVEDLRNAREPSFGDFHHVTSLKMFQSALSSEARYRGSSLF